MCAGISPPQANFSRVVDPARYIDSGATNHVTHDACISLNTQFIMVQKNCI